MTMDATGGAVCREAARRTRETDVKVSMTLGSRETSVATGIGFFDHILTAAGYHGRWGLAVAATGDLHVDDHHLVEDVGLVIGAVLAACAGPDRAVVRFAHALVPMDDALALVAVDVSGRGGAYVDDEVGRGSVRGFEASLVKEFLGALAREAGITLHARILAGENTHHRLEALFKALGRAIGAALAPAQGGAPSTKGVL